MDDAENQRDAYLSLLDSVRAELGVPNALSHELLARCRQFATNNIYILKTTSRGEHELSCFAEFGCAAPDEATARQLAQEEESPLAPPDFWLSNKFTSCEIINTSTFRVVTYNSYDT